MKFHHIAAFAAACSLAAFLTGCGNSAPASEMSETSAVSEESAAETKSASAEDVEKQIGSDMTIGVLPITAHAGDKAVPVSVQIWNNSGFAAFGIQLYYDSKLKPVTAESNNEFSDAPAAKCELGNAAQTFMKSCLIGEEDHMIVFAGLSGENSTEDGKIVTFYFDVPDDAPAGHSFSLVTAIDSFNDEKKQSLNVKTLDGAITIE